MAANLWSSWRSAGAIWIISAIIFYLVFRSAMENSTSLNTDFLTSNSERRSRLYEKMARDLDEHGMKFLQGGKTSQSLSLNDIFEIRDGSVTPKPKAADPPVRANVLYLNPEFSDVIAQAVREIFLPYFAGAIWFQNASLFHFSMFHAYHHLAPVIATDSEVYSITLFLSSYDFCFLVPNVFFCFPEIEDEASAVKAAAQSICPLKIILDRVVLTSTGVLLGCWQVISGPDPVTIRAKLRNALPHSPKKQLYDPVMLHTSFARILGFPKATFEEMKNPTDSLQFFHELVKRLNDKLHGFKASVSELWYVEECELLALALDGRMKVRRFSLAGSSSSTH